MARGSTSQNEDGGEKKPSGLLPHIFHKDWNKAGLKRKRDGYKTRRGEKKTWKRNQACHRINISRRRQACLRLSVRAPVMEGLLPIARWLPALGGEDVPSAPLPSRTGYVPALCSGEVLKSPRASKTVILQHLCFEPGRAWWEVLLLLPSTRVGLERVLPRFLAGGGLSPPWGRGEGDQSCHAACLQRDRGRVVATRPLQPTTALSRGSWFAQIVPKVCSRQCFPGKKTKPTLFFFFLLFSWKNPEERESKKERQRHLPLMGKKPCFLP